VVLGEHPLKHTHTTGSNNNTDSDIFWELCWSIYWELCIIRYETVVFQALCLLRHDEADINSSICLFGSVCYQWLFNSRWQRVITIDKYHTNHISVAHIIFSLHHDMETCANTWQFTPTRSMQLMKGVTTGFLIMMTIRNLIFHRTLHHTSQQGHMTATFFTSYQTTLGIEMYWRDKVCKMHSGIGSAKRTNRETNSII
jgi:hypothetical protein